LSYEESSCLGNIGKYFEFIEQQMKTRSIKWKNTRNEIEILQLKKMGQNGKINVYENLTF